VLALFAACLVLLIVLPLSWLAVYTSPTRPITDAAEFRHAFTDPDFLDPLLTPRSSRHLRRDLLLRRGPDGMAGVRNDMPGGSHRALVTASFGRRRFWVLWPGIAGAPTADCSPAFTAW